MQYLAVFFALFLGLSSSDHAFAFRGQNFTSGDDSGAALVYSFDGIRVCRSAVTDNAAHPCYCADPINNLAACPNIAQPGLAFSESMGTGLVLRANSEGNRLDGNGNPLTTVNLDAARNFLNVNWTLNERDGMPDQGYLGIQAHRNVLKSDALAAGNLLKQQGVGQCGSEFTVQMWVRPHFPFHGNQNNTSNNMDTNDTSGGAMIIGVSNSEGATNVQNPDWGVFQTGMSGDEKITFRVRTAAGMRSVTSIGGALTSVRELVNDGTPNYTQWNYPEGDLTLWTEIIASLQYDPGTNTHIPSIYVNRIPATKIAPVTYQPSASLTSRLVVGNELVPIRNGDNSLNNINAQQNWSGAVGHIAIYCRGYSRAEIVGNGALPGTQSRLLAVQPDLNTPISSERQYAQKIAQRLTGVLIPIDHPDIIQMEQLVKAGDVIGAAQVITGDRTKGLAGNKLFLNVIVKQMALPLSNREETMRVPLNDMAASIIGITRDERDARELLTSNFYYVADPAKAKVRSHFVNDVLLSNNHFRDLDNGDWDIGGALVRVSEDPGEVSPAIYPKGQQILVDPVLKTYTASPDPAGVITSRAFMSAHAIAGTNRRLVEHSLREFLCTPISEAADTSAVENRIGNDVERRPGGDKSKFDTSCKGCHTIMDGMRGAFAYFNFQEVEVNNIPYQFIRHTQSIHDVDDTGIQDNECNDGNTIANESPGILRVVRKMNHNCQNNFSTPSNRTVDNSFVNYATGFSNKERFGWEGPNAKGGNGVGQFGRMIADSRKFSQCMAKRVYESVCLPGNPYNYSLVQSKVEAFGSAFKANNYNLKRLFQMVVADPICIKLN